LIFKRYQKNNNTKTKLESDTSQVITDTKRDQANIEEISPLSTN